MKNKRKFNNLRACVDAIQFRKDVYEKIPQINEPVEIKTVKDMYELVNTRVFLFY